ncbi:MAG TPA: DUF2321 domain-containing protein [Solirubrobacteraceae bacterium]|jgi:hypothetical protein|nr:DUF2321 domain-containing protein [Solirubrobacteraceae bacterium]
MVDAVNGEYRPAAICRRGHVQTSDITLTEFGPHCPNCGAEVLIQCPACQQRIRGRYYVPRVVGGGTDYRPPDFCDHCGAAFPWLSRQGRIFELQNRLDGEQLDPADELAVREQLEALVSPDLDEEEERQRWARVKKLAPRLWESSQPVIETLVQAAIRASI